LENLSQIAQGFLLLSYSLSLAREVLLNFSIIPVALSYHLGQVQSCFQSKVSLPRQRRLFSGFTSYKILLCGGAFACTNTKSRIHPANEPRASLATIHFAVAFATTTSCHI